MLLHKMKKGILNGMLCLCVFSYVCLYLISRLDVFSFEAHQFMHPLHAFSFSLDRHSLHSQMWSYLVSPLLLVHRLDLPLLRLLRRHPTNRCHLRGRHCKPLKKNFGKEIIFLLLIADTMHYCTPCARVYEKLYIFYVKHMSKLTSASDKSFSSSSESFSS